MINAHDITALVLAGGRGSRMGGVDKGLQTFNGMPLALHTLMRLQMQQGGLIGEVMINANRNLAAYEAFCGAGLARHAGRLRRAAGGFHDRPGALRDPLPAHRALRHAPVSAGPGGAPGRSAGPARTPRSPWRPRPRKTASVRTQPVFCLLRADLLESLVTFTQDGGRKIDAWTALHKTVIVPFDASRR